MPLTAGLFPGAGADSASLRPHINPVHIGQLWGLPALAAHIPSCLHWALALGTALAGTHTAASSTPSPQLPMGSKLTVGLGAGQGSGPLAGRRLARQCPCPAASSPRRCILPEHPFPAGYHARATGSGQGHRHQAGSAATAILLC